MEQVFDGCIVTASPVAELFVLENAKAARKLEVLVWSIKQVGLDEDTTMQHVYLLQVVDM